MATLPFVPVTSVSSCCPAAIILEEENKAVKEKVEALEADGPARGGFEPVNLDDLSEEERKVAEENMISEANCNTPAVMVRAQRELLAAKTHFECPRAPSGKPSRR